MQRQLVSPEKPNRRRNGYIYGERFIERFGRVQTHPTGSISAVKKIDSKWSLCAVTVLTNAMICSRDRVTTRNAPSCSCFKFQIKEEESTALAVVEPTMQSQFTITHEHDGLMQHNIELPLTLNSQYGEHTRISYGIGTALIHRA
jgi:hypothetical protein